MKVISILFLASLAASIFCNEDLVSTPGGYYPRSCVHQVGDSDGVLHHQGNGDFHLKQSNGTTRVLPRCDRQRNIRANEQFQNGWVVDAYYGSGIYTLFNATWTVPAAPTTLAGQTIFIFTAFEGTYQGNLYIIQPVLQWGNSGAGGGNYWSIASWCAGGTSGHYSPLQRVNVGDTIVGTMQYNSNNGTWSITTHDATSKVSTVLNINTGQQSQYAYVTLEVANAAGCADYPAGHVVIQNMSIKDGSTVYTPSWTPQVTSQCSEGLTVNSPSSITITF